MFQEDFEDVAFYTLWAFLVSVFTDLGVLTAELSTWFYWKNHVSMLAVVFVFWKWFRIWGASVSLIRLSLLFWYSMDFKYSWLMPLCIITGAIEVHHITTMLALNCSDCRALMFLTVNEFWGDVCFDSLSKIGEIC